MEIINTLNLDVLLALLPSSWAGAAAAIGAALSALAFGTITASNTVQGITFFRTELLASTADTTAAIAHGLGSIAAGATPFGGINPADATVTPIGATVDFYLSRWRVVSVDSTNVNVQKTTASLSGGAAVQCALVVRLPHSLVR